MAFCQKCGNPLSEDAVFCRTCGAKNEPVTTDNNQPHNPPASSPTNNEQKPKGTSSGKGLWIALSALLMIAVIGLGILLVLKIGELNNAQQSISDLEHSVVLQDANIIILEGKLAIEQSNVANLNTQLAGEKSRADSLQNELTSAQGTLSATQARVSALEADLKSAKDRVSALEAEITNAENRITALNAELADMQHANELLSADLSAIRSPRNFNSQNELFLWLQQDDTNTNPAYSSLSRLERAYVLQVKALRDGYIISVIAGWDIQQNVIGVTNSAIAGGMFCLVNADDDSMLIGPSVPVPLTPLP